MKFSYRKSYYKKNQNEDLFMQAFLKNTILRDSCYNCHFKKLNRISDITLADYWGIQNVHPELNDNKGTSILIVNSIKGEELFNQIKDKIKFVETDIKKIIEYNPALIESAKMDKNRKLFFENLDNIEFDELVKKYTYKRPLYRRILSKIKRIIKRIVKR